MSDPYFDRMIQTKHAAERRIRVAFDERWGVFWKCDTCGHAHHYEHPTCALCGRGVPRLAGYSPPPECQNRAPSASEKA